MDAYTGPSTRDGGLKIAIFLQFLHERWDCKALYYRLSSWQNATLTNTAGFGDQRWDFKFYCFSDSFGLDLCGIANNFNVKYTF